MRYNALLKLHQRQVDILDIIVSCSNRIAEGERDLKRLESEKDPRERNWQDFMRSIPKTKDKLIKYNAVKSRLIAYYLDVQGRINKLYPETFKGQEGPLNEAHALMLTDHIS